ncbi:MAG: 3-phosphoshikimate 1-carboxyvinyltransferase [Clostridia bacterium]|nr:3-phosphoshikimate 1-carboxyvinyltransferase [Clostridia bacterium]
MNLVIHSRKLSGKVHIPSSKSAAHRALICAAFSNAPTRVKLRGLSEDIRATIRCLSALGAGITEECDALLVSPVKNAPKDAVLDCGESGSTLRFLLPICAALGVHASFVCHGRLASRPMDDLVGALSEHGITFTGTHEIRGQLTGGTFRLRGNISSQYLTGLLFALSLLGETSEIRLSTKLESASYVTLTTSILAEFGAKITQEGPIYLVRGIQRFTSPSIYEVEGDYSACAFWIGTGVRVCGLKADSLQGDSAILPLLMQMGAEIRTENGVFQTVRPHTKALLANATDIPDLVPPLAVLCAAVKGESRITGAARLRFKESDRIQSTLALLTALGVDAEELPDGLVIRSDGHLSGGTVDAMGDHRIAMSAALASHFANGDITVLGAECVNKSYPAFWEDFASLNGVYTQG